MSLKNPLPPCYAAINKQLEAAPIINNTINLQTPDSKTIPITITNKGNRIIYTIFNRKTYTTKDGLLKYLRKWWY